MKLLIAFVSISLTACAARAVPVGQPVHRTTYSYAKLSDGTYRILMLHPRYLDAALNEIGCDHEYVCLHQRIGDYLLVEQKRK